MKRRDLEKHLRKHGCVAYERGGKHEAWLNPANDMQTVVPRHNEIPTGTAKAICRQLGVPTIRIR